MEQVDTSPSSSSAPVALKAGESVAQEAVIEPARPSAPRQRISLARWIIKSVLFVVVSLSVKLFSGIRRFPLVAVMVVIMVVGTWMALASGVFQLPGLGGGTVGSSGRMAVEAYLTGQQRLNAMLMWEALSEDYRAAMQRAGRSANDLQAQMELGRSQGISYTGYQYIADTKLRDGRGVFLYVVTAEVATPQGTVTQQNPYTFTVDRNGKIINIE